VKVTRVELRDIQPSQGVQQAMEQQMTAEREKRAAILRSEGERDSQVNAARGRAEAMVLDAEAQAKQQALLAQARADAATRLAQAMQANPQAAEAMRLLLASDWMTMGEQMAQSPGGSVLMVDPQSPAALLTALRGLQQGQS
jgi:regulator of protease activity HflC (stomatin/prohibitin superfamily)